MPQFPDINEKLCLQSYFVGFWVAWKLRDLLACKRTSCIFEVGWFYNVGKSRIRVHSSFLFFIIWSLTIESSMSYFFFSGLLRKTSQKFISLMKAWFWISISCLVWNAHTLIIFRSCTNTTYFTYTGRKT